ncbi:MFS transporter [Paenibacillus alvei]|uniref:MFS transporter n=1 Tax=Paenibacillus alvei TaxID=44250 RepID=UPI00228118FA|nr:MFS transporter [Paenibacillus alvei]
MTVYSSVLKNRMILFYLAGAGISQLGNVITGLAFLFLSYERTQSSILTTVMAITQAAPYLLFGLAGGVIADSVNKKCLLLWIDIIRVPIILSLVFIYQMNLLGYWHLIVVSFLIQSLGCFYNPAYRAVLPLITSVEDRTATNSLFDIVTRGVQMLGPILSIGLLHSGQIIHFFTIDALTYLISAFFILKLHWKDNNDAADNLLNKTDGIFNSIKDFFNWVKGEYTIRTLLFVTFLIVFFHTWVWQVGLLLQLLETQNNGEQLYSLLMGWYGAGVITVNIVIPFVWKKLTLTTYLIGSIVWGVGILVLGFATHLSTYFIGILIAAIGLPISGLARVYLIQTWIPVNKLGRAFSFNAVLLYGSNVLSLSLFGALSSLVEIRYIFVFCGSMMVIGSFVYLFRIFPSKNTRRDSVETFK